MPAQRPWTAEEWKITVLSAYWQYFLTLTFAQLGTRWGRIHRVENWLRWVARQGNTHRDRLLYVIRWECGEIGDRPHCHMFLGGMKDVSNPLSMCFILMDNWRKREGICQVRVFERARVCGREPIILAAETIGTGEPTVTRFQNLVRQRQRSFSRVVPRRH